MSFEVIECPSHSTLAFIYLQIQQQDSFTQPPILSSRFSSAASLQLHSVLPSISQFAENIQRYTCKSTDTECADRISALDSADSVDLDYDAISHTLTVSAFWSRPLPGNRGWTETITKSSNTVSEKVEVGLLASEKAVDKEDLSLGGFLAVVGETDKLSMFYLYVYGNAELTTRKNRPCFRFPLDITLSQTLLHTLQPLKRPQVYILP